MTTRHLCMVIILWTVCGILGTLPTAQGDENPQGAPQAAPSRQDAVDSPKGKTAGADGILAAGPSMCRTQCCWCRDQYDSKPCPCLRMPRFCGRYACYQPKCAPRVCPPRYCPSCQCYDKKCGPRVLIPCRFPAFYRCPPPAACRTPRPICQPCRD